MRARAFLGKLGALPWAAFEDGQVGKHRGHWWTDACFVRGLALWREHAANLSWRHAREEGPEVDPVREAAILLMREPWRAGDPLALIHARGLLMGSARTFEGSCQRWLEGFIGSPGQTPECRADLVRRADMDGSAAELRGIWEAAKTEAAPVSAASAQQR